MNADNRKYGNFDMVTVVTPYGPQQYPCEHTTNPHLVITPSGVDAEGRPAFGYWTIVVVPHQLSLPIPAPHFDDVETVRWMAQELAKSDIDWTAPRDVLTEAVLPVYRDLIERADYEDAENTPPQFIPASTMRQMSEANARVAAAEVTE
jgi:hypothetical protein